MILLLFLLSSIEDDDEIERKLETVDINQKDEKCVIQWAGGK